MSQSHTDDTENTTEATEATEATRDATTIMHKRRGRPTKSPEGPRVVLHLTLSPEAHKLLGILCDRPVAPIPMSAMIEYLITAAMTDRMFGNGHPQQEED